MKNRIFVFLKTLLPLGVVLASAAVVCAATNAISSTPPKATASNAASAVPIAKPTDLAPFLADPAHATLTTDAPAEVATNVPLAAVAPVAPDPGFVPTPGVVSSSTPTNDVQAAQLRAYWAQLEEARKERHDHSDPLAAVTLIGLLETNSPAELKRQALFELALVEQDQNQPLKAVQIFAQYLNRYPDDPSTPEVLLRQGMIYREMGVTSLAISKFYAVMSTALKLKLDYMDYYKKLVLQAQVEIADTYYMEGKPLEAADFFARLLKTDAAELNKQLILYKFVRSLSSLTNHAETVAKAETYLEMYPSSADVPEVRFLLASTLKKLGRNQESMKQVLLLLQSQEDNVKKNPEMWIYWQQRAGNEIANQLYKEGDYMSALEIYLNLANLNKSPAWQLPVWYQTALVYEQLQQWQKATDLYTQILDEQKALTEADSSPSLKSLFEMAKWRKDYIGWVQKSKVTNLSFQRESHPASAAVAQ